MGGGRGVKSVEAEYKQTKIKSAVKLYRNEDPSMGLICTLLKNKLLKRAQVTRERGREIC